MTVDSDAKMESETNQAGPGTGLTLAELQMLYPFAIRLETLAPTPLSARYHEHSNVA